MEQLAGGDFGWAWNTIQYYILGTYRTLPLILFYDPWSTTVETGDCSQGYPCG
ncbi:MAG TPA: hypothetical protein VFV50_10015 [Bdellovibrionales bacterium]|nr:hypothetical protein [Bdellovibrionales bacterium]